MDALALEKFGFRTRVPPRAVLRPPWARLGMLPVSMKRSGRSMQLSRPQRQGCVPQQGSWRGTRSFGKGRSEYLLATMILLHGRTKLDMPLLRSSPIIRGEFAPNSKRAPMRREAFIRSGATECEQLPMQDVTVRGQAAQRRGGEFQEKFDGLR
jgi:hypothetical protein